MKICQENKGALLLIRTPFQSHLATSVLAAEKIREYDVLYFTAHDSKEDQHYFSQLAKNAGHSHYVFVPPASRSIITEIRMLHEASKALRDWKPAYELSVFSSLDSLTIATLVARRSDAFITFDDGCGNIIPGAFAPPQGKSGRTSFYRFLLGAPPQEKIINSTRAHYTMFPGKENLFPDDKLVPVKGWTVKPPVSRDKILTYFVGSPHELWSDRSIATRFANAVSRLKIDYYVMHPMEDSPVCDDIPVLDKHGKIAEDAILESANGNQIRLVGTFSSVLLNLSEIAVDKRVLVPNEHSNLAPLWQSFGCEVVEY